MISSYAAAIVSVHRPIKSAYCPASQVVASTAAGLDLTHKLSSTRRELLVD